VEVHFEKETYWVTVQFQTTPPNTRNTLFFVQDLVFHGDTLELWLCVHSDFSL